MRPSLMSYVTLVLTAVVIAVLALLALVPPFLDWNNHRDSLATVLSHALGEPVRLEGDVSLRMLPSPSIETDKVELGDLVYFDELRLETDWLSLLDGSLQLNRAVARGMEAQLLRKNGEGWHLPLSAPGRSVPVKRIEIETSKILLQDEQTGIKREISLASAQVESGSLRAMVDTSGSPLGDWLDLRLALDRGGQSFVTDVSLQAIFPQMEMGFKGKWENSSLNGEIKAEGQIEEQQIHLRGTLGVKNDRASLMDIMLQLGDDHWRGGGDILALSGQPSLDISLHTGIFDLKNAVGIPQHYRDLQASLQDWFPVDGNLLLQVENLLWEDATLGEGRLAAVLSQEKFAVNLDLEKLSGGGHLYLEAHALRDSDSGDFATLVGDLTIYLERPDRFPHIPSLAVLQKPVRLDGRLSLSHDKIVLEEINLDYATSLLHGGLVYNKTEPFGWEADWQAGRLAIQDGKELFDALAEVGVVAQGNRALEGKLFLNSGIITGDGYHLGNLAMRLRLLQNGIVIENLRFGERPGIELETDGFLFWPGENGGEGQEPEGHFNGNLHLATAQARDEVTALLSEFDVQEGDLFMSMEPMFLEGEWSFESQIPDRLEIVGDAAGGSLSFEAKGILPLLQAQLLENGRVEDAEAGLKSSLRASWRRENNFAELEGSLSASPEFFQAKLQAGGEDLEQFLSFWLARGEAGNPGRVARPFLLQTDLAAVSITEGKRLSWKEMTLSYSGTGNNAIDEDEKKFTFRGDGWIAEGGSKAPFRLHSRLETDELELAGWDFLSFFQGRENALSSGSGNSDVNDPAGGVALDRALGEAPFVLATRIGKLRIGDLALDDVGLEIFADFRDEIDLAGWRIEAQARLFGGEAEVLADFSGSRETSWLFDVRDLQLQQMSSWLWGNEFLRGRMDMSLQATGDARHPETLRGLGEGHLSEGEVCCIDIVGLREAMRDRIEAETTEIGAYATPQLERDIWSSFGTGNFVATLKDGRVEQRFSGNLEKISDVIAEIDLVERMLRLEADFPVLIGEKGNAAELRYIVEGELLTPMVSFQDQALGRLLEGMRLEQVLEELEGGAIDGEVE